MYWRDVIKMNESNMLKAAGRKVVAGWNCLEIRELGNLRGRCCSIW